MAEFDIDRFAVIADIHGNADALRAVLTDIAAQELRSVINLGDHLSGPLAASEVAQILMARDFVAVRGNHDRWLLEQTPAEMGASDRLAYEQLAPDALDWLRALPPVAWVGEDIFLCHAMPEDDNSYWLERVTAAGEIVLRDRSEIAAAAEGIEASLILCAHTHVPRRVDLPDGRVILNPGSVGCPGFDDDLPVPHVVQAGTAAACYAVVERREAGWMSSFRHVPYDPMRMAALAREAGRNEWAAAVASGWIGGA
ncbi:metallophosphoesterase family protein [Algicella marina]|uniref:Metallophosphoesterase n=1 Tax=Algicella marina TaxID=2683284 RepID=A0A6P1T4S0_9RHOB|nr:metallophosphoesterase family protein [Algicella marina]QHQ37007.1 metallophosphoesterase [Algicella marina]